MLKGQLLNATDARDFILAGNARITLVSKKTGTRFTFRIRRHSRHDPSRPWFVEALTGSDNESSYQFLGTIFNRERFAHGKRSRISPDAPSARAFFWTWNHLAGLNRLPSDMLEVWHEGRCGRCGRALTVPESVERGIGPECSRKMEVTS